MTNKTQNVAEQLWDEVKGKLINLFALPNQTVETHFEPAQVEPSKLYLTIKDKNATALLPALEESLGKSYTVEMAGRFVCVARA